MPELPEVSRIVHYIRQHLVGKTITKALVQQDDLIFNKVGTNPADFQTAMQGKTVQGAGQQGKYFWITMSSPPHPVLHLGMTGWLKIKQGDVHFYQVDKPEDKDWPPKYWKFVIETDGNPQTQAAFVDPRRLGRIRLLNCRADDIRFNSPLKENGPDPVQDEHMLTHEYLTAKMKNKKVPIKAFLIEQSNISGIGNWMGDEILYNARIHPEQYCHTLSDDQIKEIRSAIIYVCKVAVDALGDSEKFPENWIFKHRWLKGKQKGPMHLPSGEELVWVTVGGRTSAMVPSLQKKIHSKEESSPDKSVTGKVNGTKRKRSAGQSANGNSEKKASETKSSTKQSTRKKAKEETPIDTSGRRRSARLK